jgi:putative Ca2+/H+ antiporter (TMEM165/GDT1 family)
MHPKDHDVDVKAFLTVFATVFIAELGDKTQLVTLLYATQSPGQRLLVFAAAAGGLVLAAAVAVLAAGLVARWLDPHALSLLAGCAFIAIGAWTLYRALA